MTLFNTDPNNDPNTDLNTDPNTDIFYFKTKSPFLKNHMDSEIDF